MKTILIITSLLLMSCGKKDVAPTQTYAFKTYHNGVLKDSFKMDVILSGEELTMKSSFTSWKGTVKSGLIVVKSSSGIEATGEMKGDSLNIKYWGFEEKGVRE